MKQRTITITPAVAEDAAQLRIGAQTATLTAVELAVLAEQASRALAALAPAGAGPATAEEVLRAVVLALADTGWVPSVGPLEGGGGFVVGAGSVRVVISGG